MAVYRNVYLSFWTDNKVEDNFTPEDKYFYLYLLTNPQTNICGCYEVSYKQLTNQTGYNEDTVNRLIDRFEKIHELIKFSRETKEILLLNWYKYNWNKSEDTLKGVLKVAEHIKHKPFKKYVKDLVENIKNGVFDRPPIDPLQASVSDTDSVSVTDSNTDTIKDIVSYLNNVLGTRYSHKTKNTQKHINARLSDGYSLEEFKIVIDKKVKEWKGTDMERHLCPDTLFGTKFEKYLNQNIVEGKAQQPYQGNQPKKIDWDNV